MSLPLLSEIFFFHLYQQNSSALPKFKFMQAFNNCNKVHESTELTCANKTGDFFHFPPKIVFSTINLNLLFHLKLMVPRFSLLHLIRKICLENFLRTPLSMTLGTLKLLSFLELICNCIIFTQMLGAVITTLDSSKVLVPDFIPVMVMRSCLLDFPDILADFLNICLKESCFPDCYKSQIWTLYLKIFSRYLWLKTTTLQVFCLLVKFLRSL